MKNKYGFTREEINFYKKINGNSLNGIENIYLSQAKFQSLRKYLNLGPWRPILHNKWIFENYFTPQILKKPKAYGLLHPRFGRTSEGEKLTSANELNKLVKGKGLNRFVIKHIGGGLGNLVYIIVGVSTSDDHLIYQTIDGKELVHKFIDEIVPVESGNLQGFIVQEFLEPHQVIRSITGGGLTSIRINTLFLKKGTSKPQCAFIRLGTKGKATDHTHRGGVYAAIELETGMIQKGVYKNNSNWMSISCHPVTGKKFAGIKIPGWEEMKEGVVKLAERCPGLNWVGWDLIATSNGPYLIEGNVGLDMEVIQSVVGGFMSNGIFNEWMEELDLPEFEKTGTLGLEETRK